MYCFSFSFLVFVFLVGWFVLFFKHAISKGLAESLTRGKKGKRKKENKQKPEKTLQRSSGY